MGTIIAQYLLLLYIPIGLYIAYTVCPKTTFIIRIIILLPTLSAIFTINTILAGDSQFYSPDVLREITSLTIYILLAIVLSGKRVLSSINRKYTRRSNDV